MELVQLYYPLLFILVPLFAAFKVKKSGKVEYTIPITFGGVIKYTISLKGIFLYRLLLFTSFIPTLLFYTFYDYSKLFPKNLSLEIFYDKEGIMTNLNKYSPNELSKMNIDTNFSVRDTFYFRSLDKEIQKFTNIKTFFSTVNGSMHSEGYTSFIVEKINGCQKYQIKESNGEVTHLLEQPENTPLKIKSFFDKMNSPNDYIEVTLLDIVRGGIILKPLFKQTIAENNKSDGARFNHCLCGLTKINVFPLPNYSNTIYLLKYGNRFIPVGYAIYK